MKKFLLLVVFALTVCGANAQTPVKYHGEVDLGYSIGVGTFATDRINLHTIQGVQIGKYFSAGLGIGLDGYFIFDEGIDMSVPIYLNLKGYLPVSEKVSPFVSMDIGVGIGASEYMKGLSGLYCTPAVGIRAGKFKAQLGYNIQRISEMGIGVNAGAVQLKVGVMF